MRSIKKIHKAQYRPIGDLVTYSPLPLAQLQQIDPFLLLNHHGPQVYEADNDGLPFGPHPHRGMETVTFIIDGDIMHQDNAHHKSVIFAGGIQWMTAGRGVIHSEVSSDAFKKEGGNMEILQMWLNLPASLKMTEPYYKGFQESEIPTVLLDKGNVRIQVISGEWDGIKGAHKSITNVHLYECHMKAGASFKTTIPIDQNIFFYAVRGSVIVNNSKAQKLDLVEFNNDAEELNIEAIEDSIIIIGHAVPFNEPTVSYGPFVMNTEDEIQQAYKDYRAGKFGKWED